MLSHSAWVGITCLLKHRKGQNNGTINFKRTIQILHPVVQRQWCGTKGCEILRCVCQRDTLKHSSIRRDTYVYGHRRKLYELENGNYLFVQDYSEGGYDYYYINGDTRLEIDGGLIVDECESDEEVVGHVLEELGLSKLSYGLSSLDYWEDFA